jgi:hypothetical protein
VHPQLIRPGGRAANIGVHGRPALGLDQFIEAYDMFACAGDPGALKVVPTRNAM